MSPVAANLGPAVHLALLGAIVVLALVVLAVRRVGKRRGLRDAPGEQPQPDHPVREHDRDRPDRRSAEEEAGKAGGNDEHSSHSQPIG